jgi:hypothetical protein
MKKLRAKEITPKKMKAAASKAKKVGVKLVSIRFK